MFLTSLLPFAMVSLFTTKALNTYSEFPLDGLYHFFVDEVRILAARFDLLW